LRIRIASRSNSWLRSLILAAAALLAAIGAGRCHAQPSIGSDWHQAQLLGGTFSVYSYGESPYSRSAPFLELEERTAFSRGSAEFNRVRQLSGDRNANSCVHCHVKDGRGIAHAANFHSTGFSVLNPGKDALIGIFRHPAGTSAPQSKLEDVRWRHVRSIDLPGQFKVELVAPEVIVDGSSAHVDLRSAPVVYGLGLLEAIPDEQLKELVRRRPYLRYGVKGNLGKVPTSEDAKPLVGRFGWKANFSNLEQQVLAALSSELGIRNGEAGTDEPQPRTAVADLSKYLRSLAVPARDREGVDRSQRGAKVFSRAGCAMCHTPAWDRLGVAGIRERLVKPEKIYPFTDLLLHDMGPGLRAKNSDALSSYWRTPALWGIGLQASVSPQAGFLHDGRARTLPEAILWHGGEAQYSVRQFQALSPRDRDELLKFLSSL
jgi:CxxC motif-containing protein (DUF1111 family)